MKTFLLLLTSWLYVFCGATIAVAETLENSARFAEANTLFDQANAKALKDPAQAQSHYRSAILSYQFLVDHEKVKSPELFANLGNAYFFSGDHGRAVLNYQRALVLAPLQDDVRHNLRYVRTITVDELPKTRTQQVVLALTFWHRWSFVTRSSLFGLAHAAMWGLLGLLLFRRIRWHFASLAVSGAIALVFGASLLVTQQAWDNPVDGVVIDHEVIARQGDGHIYDTAFTSSLHAGTEFSLIEQRADWYHARLLDGTTCWLPVKSSTLIDERH